MKERPVVNKNKPQRTLTRRIFIWKGKSDQQPIWLQIIQRPNQHIALP
jgi:hypothetical protein